MLDFMKVTLKKGKRKDEGVICPVFLAKRSKDLMIRGGHFYAIWDEEAGLWSTDEYRAYEIIDKEIREYVEKNNYIGSGLGKENISVAYMWDTSKNAVDDWIKYTQRQLSDNFHNLDEHITFANDPCRKEDYISRKLDYELKEGNFDNYDELIGVLYSPEERAKLEWAIGSIVAGDSKYIQKFLVLYGSAGTGKSTVLHIIEKLFKDYCCSFDAKALGMSSSSFALEPFKNNPLVGIQHDGDLSRIEDNTRLNSLVSHESMTVNNKFSKLYETSFDCMLFIGTNKPVKITDAKSGIIRRLIDVNPTGKTLSPARYKMLYGKIKFELGAIAYHCLQVYKAEPDKYDNYIPMSMIGATNDFYNFVLDSFDVFEEQGNVTLAQAYQMYKEYCEDAKVTYPYSRRAFREELKSYFRDFEERCITDDGTRVRSYYIGFLTDKFETIENKKEIKVPELVFKEQPSLLDKELADCYAQYANDKETPTKKWSEVSTKLSDLDTTILHYVKPPSNHIVIDFDLKDETGKKSFERNLEAANKWPKTYAELSKGGQGIHLHYIYEGDVSRLSSIYEEDIEIKKFTGNSSLRRRLSKCTKDKIAVINSGLPLKGDDKKVVNFDAIKSEKGLRTMIVRNLRKEIHPATKPSVDFIFKILSDAYNSGMKYDVTDMRPAIQAFCASSTHQADACMKLFMKMPFKSEEPSEGITKYADETIIFYDVEVFSNLFVVVYKAEGKGKKFVKLINPTPEQIEELMKFKLVGFNCRRYDNHILYARHLGYDNERLYKLSQRIINSKGGENSNCFFGEAYNLSYTDIYDYASKKQSLKKWEIELGIHHQELGLPWDKPAPEDMWDLVAEYCCNDVAATEATWNATQPDFFARQIMAEWSGLTVNDTNRMHSTKIIFGNERNPQTQFNYRNLAEPIDEKKWKMEYVPWFREHGVKTEMVNTYFPGYEFKNGKSIYKGIEVGEGGYVYAEPGIYTNVALLDIQSMHPNSTIDEILFGPKYTAILLELLNARVAIKHKDFDAAGKMLNGILKPYLNDESAKNLSYALKIIINSIYGYTAARFQNPFKDPRNMDNIVAKRGALFMVDLAEEVRKRGYKVAHIKTDSIKIPDATPEIISFVMEYGLQHGYTFEHEATYSKMCLVNDAVYIARYASEDGKGEWTATGTQFAVPYVFKSLFTHEPIVLDDLCETKTVSSALYLDMNENLPENEHDYKFVGKAGLFCPIKPGSGGGELLRLAGEDKYASATGAKDYRWLETEVVKANGMEADINMQYYIRLADEARDAIAKYGDATWFTSDDPVPPPDPDFMHVPEGAEDGVPFDED